MEKVINIGNLQNVDFDKLLLDMYNDNKQDKNNISYWFNEINKLKNKFIIPNTIIINIPLNIYKILLEDVWQDEDIKTIDKFLSGIEYLPLKKYFIKSGNFSGKFDFDNCCKCIDIKNLKLNLKHIYYNSMLVDCPISPEFVIREFIETDNNRPSIYNGLKLNTEFRVFYNFDKHQIIDIINYWDKETMLNALQVFPEDLETFKSIMDDIENEFNQERSFLYEQCQKYLSEIYIPGSWSIDFMLVKEHTFALIDMALAENSYYLEKINTNLL